MKPLFEHQQKAVDFLMRKGSGAIFYEMGLGKTRAGIEYFSQRLKTEFSLKLLVICPLSLIEPAWGADIREFSNLKYWNCHDNGIPKGQDLRDSEVLIINYEAFIQDKNYKALQNLMVFFDFMVIVDESSRMKNPKSITTKKIMQIRDKFKYRVVMTGTPAPNGDEEYWAQINFVEPDILHSSFYAFRNSFFHLARGRQVLPAGAFVTRQQMAEIFGKGFKYEITPEKKKELMACIAPYCIRATKDECMDLPDVINEYREVTLGKNQAEAIKQMRRHLITEINGKAITAPAALTKLMKERELVSGFAIDEGGAIVEIGENPKLRELEAILDEIAGKQAIIWCQFQHEIRTIKGRLGDRATTLYAGTDDKADSIQGFKEGRYQYLIAHPRSAAHGLTFTNASYEIFYSLDYSFEAHEQARARTHRAGQTQKCTYIYLIAKDSIDEKIMEVLKNKSDAQEVLFSMLRVAV